MGSWIDLPVTDIVAQYRAGVSAATLGRAYGVGENTVRRRLVRAGEDRRQCGWTFRRVLGGPLCMNNAGYLMTIDRSSLPCSIHRARWEAHHGTIPEGHIVHHKDGDRLNNEIANLSCFTPKEHKAAHRRAAQGGLDE